MIKNEDEGESGTLEKLTMTKEFGSTCVAKMEALLTGRNNDMEE